ncbi:outer membrane protein assembly factor BamA [Lacisediminimonas profundi]|uniref:outer membrane protein assembly factor BamA n=1 Tax=Lacisediminimonas profundi TaxID=2603856 RepID=UPI00124B4A65|nr:outer membrane protein assembly factor BamA [Lacisediminimonas profundi]
MNFPLQRLPLPLQLSRRIVAAAAFALCSGPALAVDPFVVKDIRVEGIQRTEAGTVFSYLPVRVGDTFNDEKGAASIKALYATGLFKDVRIEAEGNVLVVQVEERPSIAAVEFSGTKEFDRDTLVKALKEIGLAETRIYDKALLDRAEQELKRQYLSRGLYGAQITTTVTPIERNRVNISFAVDEGTAARIREINFVGNKSFSEKELRAMLKLTTPGWFTWFSKSDQYSRQKLTGDIEAIRSFYLNRGYLEMQIESTQVSITPDRKDIYVTFGISEGEKFTVSDIKVEGETLGREEELRALIELKKGEVYNGEKLQGSIKKITERMGNFGYAFANVNASPEINREKREVAFTVLVDPGKRVYVRRINIAGNTRTRDEVVRREFRQYESSWYDGDKIRLSRDRVDRLGYFTEVNIETPEVPGTPDQVDVNMTVAEKPTGAITIGAGFSSDEKLTLLGSISQQNVFGTGNTLSVDVNTSRRYRTLALSQTNPYFTDDGVSRTYEVFLRTVRPPLIYNGDFRVQTLGGNIRFGVPFTEVDRVFFGVGYERTEVNTYFNSPALYQKYTNDFGNGTDARTNSFPFTVAWQRDNRDSALIPTTGRYQRANLEVAPAGSLRYYRTTYQQQYFRPMNAARTSVLALNGEVNYGKGLFGQTYPVFKNYFAGGIGSVRGFSGSSLQVSPVTGVDPTGGQARLIANAELQFPVPGADRTLRWFTFFDAGQVFNLDAGEKIQTANLRYSVGLGISWISPVGPLKLSFGSPLNAKDADRKQAFQFQLGTGF